MGTKNDASNCFLVSFFTLLWILTQKLQHLRVEAHIDDAFMAMELLKNETAKTHYAMQHSNSIPYLLLSLQTDLDTAIDWLNIPEVTGPASFELSYEHDRQILLFIMTTIIGHSPHESAWLCGTASSHIHRMENSGFMTRVLRAHYATKECRDRVLEAAQRVLRKMREECSRKTAEEQQLRGATRTVENVEDDWCHAEARNAQALLPEQYWSVEPSLIAAQNQPTKDNKHSNRKFAKLAKHAEKRAKYGMDSLKKMLMGGRKTAEKFAQQYQIRPAHLAESLSRERFRTMLEVCHQSRLAKWVMSENRRELALCELLLDKLGIDAHWRERGAFKSEQTRSASAAGLITKEGWIVGYKKQN